MRTRRRNEGHQSIQQLVTRHQDVGRAIAPRGLETQGESSVGAFFEAVVCERGPGDVSAEPLKAAAVSRGDGDVGVQAHACVLGHAGRSFGIGVRVVGLDAIAQASPALAGVGSGGDPGAQRGGGERREQGLGSGEGILVCLGARLDQSGDPTRRTGQDAGDFGCTRRWQG
jgi:hypothetical protein